MYRIVDKDIGIYFEESASGKTRYTLHIFNTLASSRKNGLSGYMIM